MGRNPAVQSPRVMNIDMPLGMVRDRSGTEMGNNEFRTLLNVNNVLAQSLQKRLGSVKYGSVVDNAGAKVQAISTFTDSASAKNYLKIAGGQISKWGGSSWSTVGAAVFTDTTTFVSQLMTHKTGASADVTGTASAADFTSVTDGAATMTVNAHIGKVLTLGGQQKVIIANTATVFTLGEAFDVVPALGTYNVYARQQEYFIATGTEFYKCDNTTLTQLDTSTYANSFSGLAIHDNRIWGWKKNRLYWSDIGLGEHFSGNSWKDFSSDIQCVIDFAEVLAVFEQKKVTLKFNDTPDTYIWRTTLTGYGTSSPRSAAVFPGYLLFLDDAYGVMIVNLKSVTIRTLTPYGDEIEPLSISRNYINGLIFAHSASEIANAVGWVNNGDYHLRVGTDVFVLHFQASLDSRSQFGDGVHWIWSQRSYPAAIQPASIGQYGASLIYGSAASGQVYEVDKAGQYSDDGTAITQTVEKCDWDFTGRSTLNSYDALYLYQDNPGSSRTYNLFLAPGGTTFQASPDLTWDPSTLDVGSRLLTLKIPSNPSDLGGKKDSGILFSFKITETSSLACTDIENIELHLYPGILS